MLENGIFKLGNFIFYAIHIITRGHILGSYLIDLEDIVEFKCWIKWAEIIFWLLNNEVFISA